MGTSDLSHVQADLVEIGYSTGGRISQTRLVNLPSEFETDVVKFQVQLVSCSSYAHICLWIPINATSFRFAPTAKAMYLRSTLISLPSVEDIDLV